MRSLECGVARSDYRRLDLDRLPAAQALKDGKIGAFFYASGDEVIEFSEVGRILEAKQKMLLADQSVAAINKKYGPVYVKDTLRLRANLSRNATVILPNAACI